MLHSRGEVQWNLGIRDTQGAVKNCPEFRGGQVHFYVLNRPRIKVGTEVAVPNSQVVPTSQVVLETGVSLYII